MINEDVVSRRKFPRRQFRRKTGVLFDGKYWVGNGVEIGEGGMRLMLGHALDEGRNLVVNFQIPGGSFASVQGEIRYIKKDRVNGLFSYGIVFKALKFDQKREIRAYVSARSELEA